MNLALPLDLHHGLISMGGLLSTVLVYALAKALWRRTGSFWTSPIIVTPTVLLVAQALLGFSFDAYWASAHWLTWMLGPATIAFAVPVYTQRALIRRHPITIAAGVAVGLVVGLLSVSTLAWALQLPEAISRSLMTQFVSSPFALIATRHFGGQAELAVFFVLVTGIFGMLIGRAWLHTLGLRDELSLGAALGSGAHGVGTAKAYQYTTLCGALASLTMIITGVCMVLMAPVLAPVCQLLLSVKLPS